MLTKLRPYTEYEVQVRFINNNEPSPWSVLDTVRTAEGAPSSPRNVTLTAALSNIIEIGWTTPEFVNGILDHYVVRYWGTGDEDNPMVENTTTDMYIIVNLQDNTNYSVQIAAVTGAGHGNYSVIHTIETKELPRFASTNAITVKVEATQATITWQKWNESTDIGDGPVDLYRVYYKETAYINWTLHQNITVIDPSNTSYSTTISGLQWSTSYDFTVTVKRPGPRGEGSKDTFTTKMTLCDVPEQGPVILNATSLQPTIIRIYIEMPLPENIKCNHIDNFEIRHREINSGDDYEYSAERDVTARSFTITGLRPYTEYDVEVRFNNSNAASPWRSAPAVIRTAQGVPSMPRDVTLTSHLYTIHVEWVIPEFLNGILDHYVVTYWETGHGEAAHNESTPGTNYKIASLQENVNYTVQIGAVTGAGLGDYSEIQTIETKELPRFASTNAITVRVKATQATITWQKWNESTDIGDGPVDLYRVYYKETAYINWTLHQDINVVDPSNTSYSTTISGLQWSTSYDFTVTVKRPGPRGEGSKDTFMTKMTLCDVPTKPRNVSLIAAVHSIRVNWFIPEILNGVLRYYVITYSKDNNTTKITVSDELQYFNSYLITGLVYKANYSIQVGASTGAGLGEFSDEITMRTTEKIPGKPEYFEVRKTTDNSLELAWKDPAVFSGDIEEYMLTYTAVHSVFGRFSGPKGPNAVSLSGKINTHILKHLAEGTKYKIQVKARTLKGFGETTDLTARTTFTVEVSQVLSASEDQLKPRNITESTAGVILPQLSKHDTLSMESSFDYIIIVEYDEPSARRKKREIDPGHLSSYNNSNVPYYITASIPLEDLPLTFIIGDGVVYAGYFNAPLTTGTQYSIYYGFASNVTGEMSYFIDSETRTSPFRADKPSEEKHSDYKAIYAGIFVALLLVGVVIGSIFIARRYRSKQTKDTEDLNHVQLDQFNEQGSDDTHTYCNTDELKPIAKMKKLEYANINDLEDELDRHGKGAWMNCQSVPNSMENLQLQEDSSSKQDKLPLPTTGLPTTGPLKLPTATKLVRGKPTVAAKPTKKRHNGTKHKQSPEVMPAKPQVAAKPQWKSKVDSEHVIRVEDLAEYIMKKRSADEFSTEYKMLPQGHIRSIDAASVPENTKKNRFRNVLVYDHSRVMLQQTDCDPNSDYINASYIDGYKRERAYIATQGPNKQTVDDLWRMIWEQNIDSILMATNLVENGKVKCHQYWPEEDGTWYGDFYVSLQKTEHFANYDVRTFHIQTEDSDIRIVKQFHFTVWPDMGVPLYATAALDVLKHFKSSIAEDAGPPLIHCSAGVGRTGTFIAIDAMLQMAKEEGQVDIFNFVKKARENRMHFVQVEDQYEFIHTAVMEATTCAGTAIPASDFRQIFSKLNKVDKETGRTYLESEWEKLRKVSRVPREDECSKGASKENAAKNRFPDILPFNGSRPLLITAVEEPGSTNYINASFVSAYIQKNAFLVTQMPMPNTIIDFWRMVYDYKSHSIIMFNDISTTDMSIGKYWPENDAMHVGPFQIDTLSRDVKGILVIRTMLLTDQRGKTRTINQYEVTGWPSGQDMPKDIGVFTDIMTMVEKWQQQTGNGPITVHCINGIGRCGVYCAAVSTCDRIKVEQIVDVFQAVKTLRTNRPNMLETIEQYRLCYEIILDYFESFDTYANFQ
ncbi:receptor-type tyrosine-protein phosphatase mu-like isoform X1 [Glandiceps talaboti]